VSCWLKFGDPCDPATAVGPMISLAEARRAESWVAEAVSQVAELVIGGGRHGSVLEPTILCGVDPRMRVSCEEIFAPVVSVMEFGDLRWALDQADTTPYGLAVGIFTADISTAFEAVGKLHFSSIHINETSSSRVDLMPFGGVKESGYGHEGPRYAVREMTEERFVTISY
jgi:succinate-semialdehyde dehydrogenase/glutarate-semialdehyde dehydrogenase